MVWPVDNVIELTEIITDVALSDPLSFVLVVLGTAVLGGSILVFGLLSLAAVTIPLFQD